MIDIEEALSEAGIPYATSGKNIGRDAVGITCPSCSDERNHCGMFPNGVWSCFACGVSGGIYRAIKALTQLPTGEINKIIHTYSSDFIETPRDINNTDTP